MGFWVWALWECPVCDRVAGFPSRVWSKLVGLRAVAAQGVLSMVVVLHVVAATPMTADSLGFIMTREDARLEAVAELRTAWSGTTCIRQHQHDQSQLVAVKRRTLQMVSRR